jgi:hypothetical protein
MSRTTVADVDVRSAPSWLCRTTPRAAGIRRWGVTPVDESGSLNVALQRSLSGPRRPRPPTGPHKAPLRGRVRSASATLAAYALFGSSRHLVVAGTSAAAVLLASSVGPLAHDQASYTANAAALALLV